MALQFIFAFMCSIIFAVFHSFLFKGKAPGPYNGMLYFFSIIFLFTLAVGVWLKPIGPMFNGIPWIGVIGSLLVVGLLVAEVVPHKPRRKFARSVKDIQFEEDRNERILQKEFSILIVIVCAILLAAIIYAISHRVPPMTTGF